MSILALFEHNKNIILNSRVKKNIILTTGKRPHKTSYIYIWIHGLLIAVINCLKFFFISRDKEAIYLNLIFVILDWLSFLVHPDFVVVTERVQHASQKILCIDSLNLLFIFQNIRRMRTCKIS
jgi:hypothetical protein